MGWKFQPGPPFMDGLAGRPDSSDPLCHPYKQCWT